MIYDIVIIGSGPGCFGILEALKSKKYNGSILVIDQGDCIEKRTIKDRMHGFGGAGCMTDMKLMIDNYTGGDLINYLSGVKTDEYNIKSRDFYIKNGAPNTSLSNDYTNEYIIAKKHNFRLVPTNEIIHCGTDRALEINKNIFKYFKDHFNDKLIFMFDTYVNYIKKEPKCYSLYITDLSNTDHNCSYIECDKLIIATGRSNNINLSNLNLKYDNNMVDIGVRCEIDESTQMKPWFDKFYHPKLEYITRTYKDKVRTFCSNPGGYIAIENYDDFKLVNGESFKNKKSKRTNFAILVSIPFTKPFKDGNEFAKSIARTVNKLNDSKILVQSYRDLKHGRRSTLERIIHIDSEVDRDLVCPGDLSIVMPHRYMVDIMEFIDNLDSMFTGIVDNMLLYGLEAKFYANRPEFLDPYFQVKPNLYLCGDCSGVTRGIIQATSMGIYIGEQL